MADGAGEQLTLFTGFYRCDDCGGLVERLRKTRRFRLCEACYARVVPVFPDGRIQPGSPEQEANRRYWEWYDAMEERVPRRVEAGRGARVRPTPTPPRPSDALYPLCDCGRPREVNEIGRRWGGGSGLFGGPFNPKCAVCEARTQVEQTVAFGAKVHSEWDDEDWLDHLWRVFPKAFEVGVLPGYWFELRGRLPVGDKEK